MTANDNTEDHLKIYFGGVTNLFALDIPRLSAAQFGNFALNLLAMSACFM